MAGSDARSHNWRPLFERTDFFTRFDHYLRVHITASNEDDLRAWQGFVESRIKILADTLDMRLPMACVYPFPSGFVSQPPTLPRPAVAAAATGEGAAAGAGDVGVSDVPAAEQATHAPRKEAALSSTASWRAQAQVEDDVPAALDAVEQSDDAAAEAVSGAGSGQGSSGGGVGGEGGELVVGLQPGAGAASDHDAHTPAPVAAGGVSGDVKPRDLPPPTAAAGSAAAQPPAAPLQHAPVATAAAAVPSVSFYVGFEPDSTRLKGDTLNLSGVWSDFKVGGWWAVDATVTTRPPFHASPCAARQDQRVQWHAARHGHTHGVHGVGGPAARGAARRAASPSARPCCITGVPAHPPAGDTAHGAVPGPANDHVGAPRAG